MTDTIKIRAARAEEANVPEFHDENSGSLRFWLTFSFLLTIFLIASCKTVTPIAAVKEGYLQASRLSGFKHLSLHDAERSKDLDVWLWYPVEENASPKLSKVNYPWGRLAEDAPIKEEGRRKPLIVLSHGFSGSPFDFHWMIEPLVGAGFIVVATKHSDLPGPQLNHWNRAIDVSFMLTEVLKSPFGKMIDEQRIGFAGFSLGGLSRPSNQGCIPDGASVGVGL